ncbi:hypothetical protein N0V83_003982 [Neocucurbitaria cava]|uniref:Restriction of telomere capping protein 4 n=1 Tax=Neocucurbitaria cava TaxID=798079 RepID=A0A9W8YA89_9PLEO|nr:hypothetical protein N0V83_003982 [Neocucurbitaria cava]
MVIGLTKRGAPPLLRKVGGKRHATNEDHEEGAYEVRPNASNKSAREKEEEQSINAEPLSTDDELQQPPPRTSASSRPKIPLPAENRDGELKKPQRKASRKEPAIRAPTRGSYQSGKMDKAKRGIEDDKENATSTQSSVEASQDQGWGFDPDLSQPSSSKKQKTRYGTQPTAATRNIHVKKSLPKPRGKISYSRKGQPASQEDDGVSDVSIMSDAELDSALASVPKQVEDPELCTKVDKKKGSKDQNGGSKPTTLDDVELNNILDEPSKPARLLHQLGHWVDDQAPSSSQPKSSAPQEALENLHEYIEQLPQDEEEGTRCSLCKEPVELSDYWDFWKGKDRTVKNHTAFCNTHRKKSAHAAYLKAGYPSTIDWTALPHRIAAHKHALVQILNNTNTHNRPSTYRDRYAPIALTGKAASLCLPSHRKDLPAHLQDSLEDFHTLDDKSTYPGYYGPHGRRAITEHVMKLLKNDIKRCDDAVVQASGPAAFVQAVLVPEVAVLLIMEDCDEGMGMGMGREEEAERVRRTRMRWGCCLMRRLRIVLRGRGGGG